MENHLSPPGDRRRYPAKTMFAAYSPSGAGFALLLILMTVVAMLGVWSAYWYRRSFRASSSAFSIVAIVTGALAITCSFIFPPMRTTGQWINQETGATAQAHVATDYDRGAFGYVPKYCFIGELNNSTKRERSFTYSRNGHQKHRVNETNYQIDWLFLIPQIVAILLIAIPFLRSSKPHNAG